MTDNFVTDEQWRAITENDASCDGKFIYAVKTTGIFCRPSCKSRPPKRENAAVFAGPEAALAAGYRPCKRCKPGGLRLPDEEWIAVVTEYISAHYKENLNLHLLAEQSHGSPYHLHRTFKKVTGMTPVQYIQGVRMEQARKSLRSSSLPVSAVAESVGIPNVPYFITLFKRMNGTTPAEYKAAHASSQTEGGV
ncbi:bifunctional transcriptional activator/DNA repair enzyme AdaA [Paenibacillus sp. M1]|uniref:Bifunctional transcriptional activator/DNA repair enzyme AdaA n=1 Tax=Paenibacillus haidiansis TaxID=1574488 RepID=A0ABU7VVW0_9BACL